VQQTVHRRVDLPVSVLAKLYTTDSGQFSLNDRFQSAGGEGEKGSNRRPPVWSAYPP
jgi:hypothetical protein